MSQTINMKLRFKEYPAQQKDFIEWYMSDKSIKKPIDLKEAWQYDFELHLGLFLRWLKDKHSIIVCCSIETLSLPYGGTVKEVDMTSKYVGTKCYLVYQFTYSEDIMENYKYTILTAIHNLYNPKSPF